MAAQFSVRYTVAAALIRKNISLRDFEEKAIVDPEVLELTKKIKITVDHDIQGRPVTPSTVIVKLKSGDRISEKVSVLKGQPENPLTREELLMKLKALLSYSAYPIDEMVFDEIVDMVDNLETLDDVNHLIKLLDLRTELSP